MKHVDSYKTFEGKGSGPKGKDLTVFVRFGGVNLKKQKGYSKDNPKTFHSPPAPRGFFAMPKVAQSLFLVSSLDSTQPGIFAKPKVPSSISNEKELEDHYKQYWKERDKRYQEIRREFKKIDGSIWHHLVDDVPHNEIEAKHGSWVKTSIKTWQKAFNKISLSNRYGEDDFSKNSINKTRGINGYYCKDDLEVFFDEKI